MQSPDKEQPHIKANSTKEIAPRLMHAACQVPRKARAPRIYGDFRPEVGLQLRWSDTGASNECIAQYAVEVILLHGLHSVRELVNIRYAKYKGTVCVYR
jgi:hypothetical protein